MVLYLSMLVLLSIGALACSSGDGDDGDGGPLGDIDVLAGVETNIELTSTQFSDGRDIPGVHTCYGLDRSPALSWSDVPSGTLSLALIVGQPDAPGGDDRAHWVIYDLPQDVTGLPVNISITEKTVLGGKQGRNDSKRLGWEGPCPERGGDHEGSYVFNLYALDTVLGIDVEGGARRNDVLRAMEGHVIGHGRLMGKYCQSDAGSSGSLATGSRNRGSCPPLDSE